MTTDDRLHTIEASVASVQGEVEKLQADFADLKGNVRQLLTDMQKLRESRQHPHWPCDTD